MPADPDFWHARWSAGNTPWQRDAPSAGLLAHFDRLHLVEGDEVLVPLCGGAPDMRWLLERGFRVLGVELSEIAVRGFFEGLGVRPREREGAHFRVFEGDRVRILCGDVFDLAREDVAGVAAVYDRAALVALHEPDQARYAALLARRLPPGVRHLLLTLEYDTARMQGPPFSVGEARVRSLYRPRFEVERVASADVLDEEPHLRARGLDALREHVFQITDSTG